MSSSRRRKERMDGWKNERKDERECVYGDCNDAAPESSERNR